MSERLVVDTCCTPDESDTEALGTMGEGDCTPVLLCKVPVTEADADADGEMPGTVRLVPDGDGETPGTLELTTDEEGETPGTLELVVDAEGEATGALELEADEDSETPGTLKLDVEPLTTGVGAPGEALLEVARPEVELREFVETVPGKDGLEDTLGAIVVELLPGTFVLLCVVLLEGTTLEMLAEVEDGVGAGAPGLLLEGEATFDCEVDEAVGPTRLLLDPELVLVELLCVVE